MKDEFTLEDGLSIEPRKLYVIKNEKGEYYGKSKPFWFSDINKAINNVAQLRGTKEKAKFLLQERKRCDEGARCCNDKLFYGFEKIYIVEVQLVEVE